MFVLLQDERNELDFVCFVFHAYPLRRPLMYHVTNHQHTV